MHREDWFLNMNMNVQTSLYADKGMRKGGIDETAKTHTLADLHESETALPTSAAYSISSAPTVEHFNNYSRNGGRLDDMMHERLEKAAIVKQILDSLNDEDSGFVHPIKELCDEVFPWWLKMMIRVSGVNSDWIMQLLEEAGLENLDTEYVKAAEELIQNYGSRNSQYELR
jgi:uncharacterized protein YihD (DUF1040 family)